MNKQVEVDCGKVQVKGKEGIRGMSSPDIEKFIEEKVAATGNKDLMSDFVRIKKGKMAKGESKRLKYCAFLKQRLPAVWNSLTKKEEEKPPSVPVPPVIKKLLENVEILPQGDEFFQFMPEENEPRENVNVENEPVENIYNLGSNQPSQRIFVPYPRESRAKIPDPASGKLSKRLLKTIETKLRRMKRQGVKLPNFKNQAEMYKFVMTKVPEKSLKEPLPRKPFAAPKRLTFEKGNGRKPTLVTGGIALATGTRLTGTESRQALKQAEVMVNKLMKNMSPDAMRVVLLSRYAPGNVNKLMKNLDNKKSYENVLNVVKRFETERARILKNLSETKPVEPTPSKPPSSSFTMIRGNPTLANLARRARAKATANRTPAEKRALKFMEASARMRSRRVKKAGANVKTTERLVLMNSSSNSNSNNNSPPPKEMVKSPVSSVNSEPNLPNVVRNINSGTININKLNREQLVKVAKNVYNVAKPGEKIPFEKANMEKIRKLVKAGVKKIMKGKQ